jgi:zinc/manganese transport system substrate-binding protein
MMISRRSFLIAALALPLTLPTIEQSRAADRVPVVATFSILADFVTVVGGERVAVRSLVGPNGDAHVYSPTPADAKALAQAKVVFVNGLGFEGWLDRLVKASGTKAPIVVATKGIDPLTMEEDGHGHAHSHAKDGDKTVTDPHAWQSVVNAKAYVANIRDGLTAADPAGATVYAANAEAYLKELDALEADVRAAIAKVPADQRRVITSHDAFGYFSDAYAIEFLAPQGVSTESEATAKQVAGLIRQIRKEKIKAVFVETVSDPRLVERIAKETGVKVGGSIYSDALSASNGPAGTYIAMIRQNVALLTAAMAGS